MTLDSDEKEIIIVNLTEPGVLKRWSAKVLASFRLVLYSTAGGSPKKELHYLFQVRGYRYLLS
jgi:hypothetical protein